MKLPPFGKQFQRIPPSGVRVATGPTAWDFQRNYWQPIMVLPVENGPDEFIWPSGSGPALIFECGEYNDERLEALARALLQAGASSVVAIREALLNDYDPRVFYDAEVIDVAA